MSEQGQPLAREISEFVHDLDCANPATEVAHIARRCILDGLGVALAGSDEPIMAPLYAIGQALGGHAQSRVIGDSTIRLPVSLAALWNGTAGHAMDWDDTQLSETPGRIYGLLTHPTTPVLAASLAIADMLGGVTGTTFLTAFVAGTEVSCKLAEAIDPLHYRRGFHSSGTIGTFGATAAAAKLLSLDQEATGRALAIAASMASGIRANFGTMTKPLHVGRAAENGVLAALYARHGLTASHEALDGPWGYLSVATGGQPPDLHVVHGRLGAPFSLVSPGVSIKPYPSGVLTHPTMDAMLALVLEHDLAPDDIGAIRVQAGANILEPIRYGVAQTELEAKFSFPFLMAAIAISRKAAKTEFSDTFVRRPDVQRMQARVTTSFDEGIDALGYDLIRSRVTIVTKEGRTLTRDADEHYRGGPTNPMTDAELAAKFAECARGLLDRSTVDRAIDFVWALDDQPDVTTILELLNWSSASALAERHLSEVAGTNVT